MLFLLIKKIGLALNKKGNPAHDIIMICFYVFENSIISFHPYAIDGCYKGGSYYLILESSSLEV